jgi:hypothetical protein
MNTFLFVSIIVLWARVLLLGFLVLGALRALGLVNWRVDQMELRTGDHHGLQTRVVEIRPNGNDRFDLLKYLHEPPALGARMAYSRQRP